MGPAPPAPTLLVTLPRRARKGGQRRAGLVCLISSHLFALLPGTTPEQTKAGLPAAGSKLGTCLFCLLWGTRGEQTAAFVGQAGAIVHSIKSMKRWRQAKAPAWPQSLSPSYLLLLPGLGPREQLTLVPALCRGFLWLCSLPVKQCGDCPPKQSFLGIKNTGYKGNSGVT